MKNYNQIETEMRAGNYAKAKRLTRQERAEMVDHIYIFNGHRAMLVAKIFITNFNPNGAA